MNTKSTKMNRTYVWMCYVCMYVCVDEREGTSLREGGGEPLGQTAFMLCMYACMYVWMDASMC